MVYRGPDSLPTGANSLGYKDQYTYDLQGTR